MRDLNETTEAVPHGVKFLVPGEANCVGADVELS